MTELVKLEVKAPTYLGTYTSFIEILFYKCADPNCYECDYLKSSESTGMKCKECEIGYNLTEEGTCDHMDTTKALAITAKVLLFLGIAVAFFGNLFGMASP